MPPLVSIICITYNQEKFIKQTLEGFLKQETDFRFEVLVHDDASSDDTVSIVRDFTAAYPDIVKPIFEKRNQYSNSGWEFLNDMFYAAKGKYIAMCEGDDFWTDQSKLQKQIDYLESRPDYALCFHPVNVHYEDGDGENRISPLVTGRKVFSVEALIKDNYINTCSVVYRRQEYKDLPNKIMPHDVYMHLYHAQFGKIGFINDVMATYRKQSGGVWWESGAHMDNIYQKHRYQLTNLFSELLKMFPSNARYKKVIDKHLDYLFNSFIDIDATKSTGLFFDTSQDFPELVARYTANKKILVDDLLIENKRLNSLIDSREKELAVIKNSRWYKLNPRSYIDNLK